MEKMFTVLLWFSFILLGIIVSALALVGVIFKTLVILGIGMIVFGIIKFFLVIKKTLQ